MFLNRILYNFSIAVKQSKPSLKLSKAALTLTPAAIDRLKEIYKDDADKLLKIGVRTKGCSGMSYTLDFVTNKAKFDEEVNQDGIKLLIDSRALLTILGSQMDYVNEKLSSQFIFYNPNIKEACGCGQSFMV